MAAAADAGAGQTPAPAVAPEGRPRGGPPEPDRGPLSRAAAAGRTVLLEPEVYELVAAAGIAVPRHRLIRSADAIDAACCEALASDQAVVKVVSPDLLHKSDVSGVRFCANEPSALRDAAAAVLRAARAERPDARLEGVLLCERVRFRPGLGREVLAAFRHDAAFGPVVVIGAGGLDSEALLAALEPGKARAMFAAAGLDEVAVRRGLQPTLVERALAGGLRSSAGSPVPRSALVELVLALARAAERWSGFDPPGGLGLAELELNPVVARDPDGRLIALDGLARVHRPEALPPGRPVEALASLLVPRSAVVIGASAEGANPGRVILRNLAAGGGIPRDRVWAIHPRASEVEGCRAFASLDALPEPADLAVVAVAADGAEAVVREIVDGRRARTVTLIAGGFGETVAGRDAETRIRSLLSASHRDPDGGVLLNGGNCLGVVSAPGRYNTFFIPPEKLAVRLDGASPLASVSQSGAYLVSQISGFASAIAPRYAISFGNQMDVTVSDYLEHLERDPEARVIAVYLEGFARGDGARFLAAARRLAAAGRRVCLYKAGRTREGSQAAASHTAAAVGDYEVCVELATAAGVLVARSLDGFEDDVLTATLLDGRPVTGRHAAVLSNAGFEATAAADALAGLELARLGPDTIERVRRLLPPGLVDVRNPVDATPLTPTAAYAGIAQALAEDEGVDALVIAGVPATPALATLAKAPGHGEDVVGPAGLATALVSLFRTTRKPVVFSVDAGPLYDPLVAALLAAGLPTFRRVDRAVAALGRFLAGAQR